MKFITLLLFFFPVFNSGNLPPDVTDFSERSVQSQQQNDTRKKDSGQSFVQGPQQNDPREEAFGILRNKCNICHAKKKRADIFTQENMERFAPEIYEQVFVKKKMPKGRKVQLTENETRILEQWIDTVLEAKNTPKT